MHIDFDAQAFLSAVIGWLTSNGLRVLLILVIAFFATLLWRRLTRRIVGLMIDGEVDTEKEKRVETLTGIVRSSGRIIIVAVAGMMLLAEFGIDLKPIIAAAGIGGIAIGFGAQSLVKDVISGFFILLEDQIRVGDVVEVAGTAGLVEKVGLRVLVLRDFEAKMHIIPNGTITMVTNLTKDYSRYAFNIGVAYREDVDQVIALMKKVGEELRSDPTFANLVKEPLEVFGLDSFGDSAINIKARITTKPGEQWTVGREFNRRLKAAFDEAGIEIPFPHQTVYFGVDKQGGAPPLRVVNEMDASGGKG